MNDIARPSCSADLAPKELNSLARQDVTVFDGNVSFNQALTQSLRGKKCSG